MKSIREIYKVGHGPSSSHTMGPQKAAAIFLNENPDAASYKAILYGSLAETGKGHQTDVAILDTLGRDRCEVVFNTDRTIELPHENTLELFAYDASGAETAKMRVMSVGGGDIRIEGVTAYDPPEIYECSSMKARKSRNSCWKSGTR